MSLFYFGISIWNLEIKFTSSAPGVIKSVSSRNAKPIRDISVFVIDVVMVILCPLFLHILMMMMIMLIQSNNKDPSPLPYPLAAIGVVSLPYTGVDMFWPNPLEICKLDV